MDKIDPIFLELGIIIATAAIFGIAARMFRQPPIIGYLIAGIVLGPLGASLIQNQANLNVLSELGIALLLFMIGLEMDWQKLRRLSSITGFLSLFQISLTFFIGFLAASFFKFSLPAATVVGFAIAFSSTVIVVKLLSEKHDLDSLYGRIAVGTLLIQDIVAIFVLALLPSLSSGGQLPVFDTAMLWAGKTAGLIAVSWLLSSYIFPRLFKGLAGSSELLFVISLAWCFIFAILAIKVGFSVEIGSFLAGVSLASLPYSIEIVGRIKSLRDFFIILFFIFLGTQINFSTGLGWNIIITLTLLVLLVKPILVMLILNLQGLRRRVAFLSGICLGQTSEFSLILVGLALKFKLIDLNLSSALTITAVISLLISPYLINSANGLFLTLRPILGLFERKKNNRFSLQIEGREPLKEHVVIFGYHRMGYHILKTLRKLGHQVLVIDFNPEVIDHLKRLGVPAIFGDAQDDELLESIHLSGAKMIISTIPHKEENTFLIQKIKTIHKRKKILSIVTAENIDDALDFYQFGADYVILPHQLSGEHVADLIKKYEEKTLARFLKSQSEEVKLMRTKKHALYVE